MGAQLIALMFAGGLGAVARWGLTHAVHRAWGPPWGTAVVNVLGCLAFGAVWAMIMKRGTVRPEVQLAILTGFMGAFTTFSTYAFETVQLMRASQLGLAAASFLVQNLIGFACLGLGLWAGRWL